VADTAELVVPDAASWRAWLAKHHDSSADVWLVLAKKETVEPTSLNHDQALEEALCHGWIDGQLRGRESGTLVPTFPDTTERRGLHAIASSRCGTRVADASCAVRLTFPKAQTIPALSSTMWFVRKPACWVFRLRRP
jgi:hypothetical protein